MPIIDNTTKSFILHNISKKVFGPYEAYLDNRILDMCIKNGNRVGFVVGNLSFVTTAGKFALTLKPELVEEAQALDEIRYKLKRDKNIFFTYLSSVLARSKGPADIKAALPALMHEYFDKEFIVVDHKDSSSTCPSNIEQLVTLYIMYRMVL